MLDCSYILKIQNMKLLDKGEEMEIEVSLQF